MFASCFKLLKRTEKFAPHLRYTVLAVVSVTAALAAESALGFAHLWDIHEIYTNHDGTVQFIELKCPDQPIANGENFLNGQAVRATSTVGGVAQSPVTFTFPIPNPVGGTQNGHLLIATSTFTAHLPTVPPDYNTLPQNFFVPDADSVSIVFSAGPDTVTVAGSLIPKDGVNSLTDANVFGVANLLPGINSPTNFAGAFGSLNLPPPSNADYNGDGLVDAADYAAWRKLPDAFGGDPAGYEAWQEQFGETPAGSGGGSIPEPATIVLLLVTCITMIFAIRLRRDVPGV